MTQGIIHNETASRFEITVDSHLCELDYQLDSGTMIILHTGVPPEVGGRGIAAQLTEAALQTARSRGWRVLPRCSYSVAYLGRHPEYADLLR